MYKRQVKLQKIFCLLALIASVLVFVYSLGLVTDLNDALGTTIAEPEKMWEPGGCAVPGAQILYQIQPFNNQLLLAGIALILLSLGLYITNTHVRRRYYIGNYVATGIWSVAALGVAVWMHVNVQAFKADFQSKVDFEVLKEYAATWGTPALTRDSTFWFDAHYLVAGLLVVMVAVLVANICWKLSLMKEEAALLAGAPAQSKSATAKLQ